MKHYDRPSMTVVDVKNEERVASCTNDIPEGATKVTDEYWISYESPVNKQAGCKGIIFRLNLAES